MQCELLHSTTTVSHRFIMIAPCLSPRARTRKTISISVTGHSAHLTLLPRLPMNRSWKAFLKAGEKNA